MNAANGGDRPIHQRTLEAVVLSCFLRVEKADHNHHAGKDKLLLTDKVRSRVAHFFEQELKACAAELGGPAKQWPARYDFSLLVFVMQLADDFDILFWCDFVA
jgi:hypothetical protein